MKYNNQLINLKYSVNNRLGISIKYHRYESMCCLRKDNRIQPSNRNVLNANRILFGQFQKGNGVPNPVKYQLKLG